MSRKPSSGIGRGKGRRRASDGVVGEELRRLSETGDMPYVNRGMPLQRSNRFFEAINRYYDYPDDDFIERYQINLYDGWHFGKEWWESDRSLHWERTFKSRFDGRTRYMKITAPDGTTHEAREGMKKYYLWHFLDREGILEKSQFVRRQR